jgi:hypothetical protein
MNIRDVWECYWNVVQYEMTRNFVLKFLTLRIYYKITWFYLIFSLLRLQLRNLDYATRLEIISDVVSERHVAEKFRYHIGFFRIGNTDTTLVFSDTTSEFFRYVPFPIPHRKLFLTVHDYGITWMSSNILRERPHNT